MDWFLYDSDLRYEGVKIWEVTNYSFTGTLDKNVITFVVLTIYSWNLVEMLLNDRNQNSQDRKGVGFSNFQNFDTNWNFLRSDFYIFPHQLLTFRV